MTAQHKGLHLAEGFHFTDHLDSPYRLAYGLDELPDAPIVVSNLDGSKRLRLTKAKTKNPVLTVCFSPDGTTLYGYDTNLWAKDVQTGAVRRIANLPGAESDCPPSLLECSPDNRVLLLQQEGAWNVREDGPSYFLQRVCRITTDGKDWRVLYEHSPHRRLNRVIWCWKQRFVLLLFHETKLATHHLALEKMDLDSGDLSLLDQSPNIEWDVTLRADGGELTWSNRKGQLYTHSLADGVTRKLPFMGTCPVWSPEGKRLAFMKDNCTLCLWDVENERPHDLAWFDPPPVLDGFRNQIYAVTPVWSPDGSMLWFTLTQRQKLSDFLVNLRIYYGIAHVIWNYKRVRDYTYTAGGEGEIDEYLRRKTGVINLNTQQVMLTRRYRNRVVWLP